MGNNASSKNEAKDECILTAEEKCKLQAIFKAGLKANKDKHLLQKDDLKSMWEGRLAPHLLERLLTHLFPPLSPSKTHNKGLDFQGFAQMFVHAVRGNLEERARLIASISSTRIEGVPLSDITEYIKDIINSYIRAESCTKQYQSWMKAGCEINPESVQLFANNLLHDLVFPGKSCKETWQLRAESKEYSQEEIQRWLVTCSDLISMQAAVFERLYFGAETPAGDDAICLYPMCTGIAGGISGDEPFPSILDMTEITFLNAALPADMREQWRFLFSTRVHGESFSKLLGNVVGKGANLIIVKDKDGHVFGGFATESWNLGPKFVGNENCFLFNLRPKMNVYDTTGYNDHYMYLNVQQQTMPNGLGMGGQLEYFGMYLDASYGTGMCSESCTTFHSPLMSGSKDFEMAHVEVWGVGEPPKSPAELGERCSILDKDNEAKAILAMAGKGNASDGYREPEDIHEG